MDEREGGEVMLTALGMTVGSTSRPAIRCEVVGRRAYDG